MKIRLSELVSVYFNQKFAEKRENTKLLTITYKNRRVTIASIQSY